MKKNKIVAFLIFLAIICFYLLKFFVIDLYRVKGESMSDTFSDNQVVIIDRLTADFKQNDVVIIKTEIDNKKVKLIKRIVAVPHDTIQIIDGEIYINDEKWEDDLFHNIYINECGIAREKVTLGEEEYFVLGDNRNNSGDSRLYGAFKKSQFIGKVLNNGN